MKYFTMVSGYSRAIASPLPFLKERKEGKKTAVEPSVAVAVRLFTNER
jgi:hypothetical protein